MKKSLRGAFWLLLAAGLIPLQGCGGGGGGGGASTPNYPPPAGSGPELISDIAHFASEEPFDTSSRLSDSRGIAGFTLPSLTRNVEFHVTDQNGLPLQSARVTISALNDRFIASIVDPLGIHESTLVQADIRSGSSGELITADVAAGSTGNAIVIAAGVVVIIKVAMLVSALIATVKIAEGLVELYDFHIENFDHMSLRTTTYRATVDELADLLETLGSLTVDVISLTHMIASGGLTTVVPNSKAYEFAAKKMISHLGKAAFQEALINLIQKSVGGAYASRVGHNTEVYVHVHHLGLLSPLYEKAFDVVPILDTTPPSAVGLVGTWTGNWNNYTADASGGLRIEFTGATGTSFTGRIYDLDYDADLGIPISGSRYAERIEFSFTDPDNPARRFSCAGSAAGATLNCAWTSTQGENGSFSATLGGSTGMGKATASEDSPLRRRWEDERDSAIRTGGARVLAR